jgi:hypothetical protein
MLLRAYYSLDISQNITCSNDISWTLLYNKILYFQHQIKLPFLNMKNEALVTFVVACVSVIAPYFNVA